jgi:hypothetical protein
LRNFTIGRSLTEDELLGPGGLERVSELLGSLKPFVSLAIEKPRSNSPPRRVGVPWKLAKVKFSRPALGIIGIRGTCVVPCAFCCDGRENLQLVLTLVID